MTFRSAYQMAVYLLENDKGILDSGMLEDAVFDKFGETQYVEDQIWEAWEDCGQ